MIPYATGRSCASRLLALLGGAVLAGGCAPSGDRATVESAAAAPHAAAPAINDSAVAARPRDECDGSSPLPQCGLRIDSGGAEVDTRAAVCGDPTKPCAPARPSLRISGVEHLLFRLPDSLRWQTNYYSAPFYAVVLRTVKAEPDSGPDSRKPCAGYFPADTVVAWQARFPSRKVFASSFGCTGALLAYVGVGADNNFLAVYAGETAAEAEQVLAGVRAMPGASAAVVRRMRAVLAYGD